MSATSLCAVHDQNDGQIISIAEYPWSTLFVSISCLLLICIDRIVRMHSHSEGKPTAHYKEENLQSKSIILSQGIETTDTENENFSAQIEDSNHLPTFNNTATVAISSTSIVNQDTLSKKISLQMRYKLLITSLTTVLALSVHSVFEAFPIGLSNEIENLLHVFIPVILHKGFEAITCGLIIQAFTYQKGWFQFFIILQIVIYAASTPLGMSIGIGLAQVQLGPIYYLLAGILLSLATGSFIFIACFEIIPLILKDSKSLNSRLFLQSKLLNIRSIQIKKYIG